MTEQAEEYSWNEEKFDMTCNVILNQSLITIFVVRYIFLQFYVNAFVCKYYIVVYKSGTRKNYKWFWVTHVFSSSCKDLRLTVYILTLTKSIFTFDDKLCLMSVFKTDYH